MLLKKSTIIDKSTLPNDPADAMSLNGFLDNVSCENLSSPHSPQMRINRLPQNQGKLGEKKYFFIFVPCFMAEVRFSVVYLVSILHVRFC